MNPLKGGFETTSFYCYDGDYHVKSLIVYIWKYALSHSCYVNIYHLTQLNKLFYYLTQFNKLLT